MGRGIPNLTHLSGESTTVRFLLRVKLFKLFIDKIESFKIIQNIQTLTFKVIQMSLT